MDGMFLQCCTGERPDTAEPTSSAAPTMSAAPTVSSVPTTAPSVSPPPSLSAAPTVSNATTTAAVTATCESNPVCNDLELSGICCPTVDGFGFLDCCSNVTEGEKSSSAMEYIAFIEGSGTSGATAWTLAAQPVTTMAGMLLSAAMLLLLH